MIKELRESLDISIMELSFVLDVDESKIMEWEETKQIPMDIIEKLQKRYSQYFNKNDKGMTILKKIENKDNSNPDSPTKLDKLFKSHVNKKSKKSKKIVVRKKKEFDNETNQQEIEEENDTVTISKNNKNSTNGKITIKKDDRITISTSRYDEKKDEMNIPAEYLKSLINENKSETFSGLRDIRKYLKLSQTELGEALEINQRKISIWEITNAKLPKEIIEKIKDKFNIPKQDLYHLIESDETKYLLENLPISKESIFYNNEIDSLNIQMIRKTFGHSLRSFANEIGVHYQTVARWEKGQGIPKDYILKEIIDTFLNRKSIKELIDMDIDVGLKEEYAHWKNEIDIDENDNIDENLKKDDVKNLLDKKLELLINMEEEGLEVDSITINSNKSLTFKNEKLNFSATFIINDEIKKSLKNLFN